ncbi:MAG: NADH-quinone oxidoreductase subunit, partial [Streptomycetaceae bacterium]|nr:NADH-quinone oxidoreductase subunit [Streptomycetaceae bacterium]
MDLKFTDAKPTDEERDAIDDFLGPPESGWDGGERTETDLRWARGGHEARDRRDLLLPALHAINDRVGWISEGALDYVCRRLTVPPAEGYGVATFYAMFSVRPRPARVLHVCTDLACAAAGAGALQAAVEEQLGPAGQAGDGVVWQPSPCLGLCERAPAALVIQAGESGPSPAPSRNRGLRPGTRPLRPAGVGGPPGPQTPDGLDLPALWAGVPQGDGGTAHALEAMGEGGHNAATGPHLDPGVRGNAPHAAPAAYKPQPGRSGHLSAVAGGGSGERPAAGARRYATAVVGPATAEAVVAAA